MTESAGYEEEGPLVITRHGPTEYSLRRTFGAVVDPRTAGDQLRARLCADGPAEEEVDLRFEGGVGIDPLFAHQRPGAQSEGWVGLLVPYAERRDIRLPRDFSVVPDATRVDPHLLASFRPDGEALVADPLVDLANCPVVQRGDEVVGWVPVRRLSEHVSRISIVVLERSLFTDDPRRLTHLRLGVFSRTLDLEFDHGRSVLCWLRDNGDPVNEYKLAAAAAAKGTHLMRIWVRRDLSSVDSRRPGGAMCP